MATTTYTGSCHCRSIRFEADIDLTKGTAKCNCSICGKNRYWSTTLKPEAFRLLSDQSALTDYRFGTRSVHWPFCKTCGVRTHSQGDIPEVGGAFVAVNIACLDGIAPETLATLPVRFCNGRDNDWMHEPTESRYL